MWINYLPEQIYSSHPDLEETNRPAPDAFEAPKHDDPDSPPAMDNPEEQWLFRIRPGTTDLSFDLGYARFALESYEVFKSLREQGAIAPDVSFQVCFPATMSAVDCYFGDAEEWPTVHDAYREGILADLRTILEVIPPDDLVVQLDVCEEVVDLTLGDRRYQSFYPKRTFDEKFTAHLGLLMDLGRGVPDELPLGIHWCYGTWGGWPMVAMKDLRLCVDLSNSLVSEIGRRIDYVHMPVARTTDAAFYAPLDALDIGETKVYLGMVHHEDGIDGFRSRLEVVREHLDDFGIGAVCGFGREDPAELGDIVSLHRECAELLPVA